MRVTMLELAAAKTGFDQNGSLVVCSFQCW